MSQLHFDIDLTQLREVGDELQASEKQIKFALSVALRRTTTTLRTLSARVLTSEFELRTASLLRKRLKSIRLSSGMNSLSSRASTEGATLWYGLNDMPASWFKGRARKVAGGAEKRGQTIADGFIAKSKFSGRQTIFKRTGKGRLPITEQSLKIEDKARIAIEDKIFDQTEKIFWNHFMRDLNARVSYKIGER